MNRRAYWSVPGLILSTLVFSTLTFLTSCSSGSSIETPFPTVLITATSGGGQSAAVGVPFTSPLVAKVTTGGTPTSGVTVTFTSPASTDGTFAGGVATATATTNASGVATSPAFTAGTTAGTYTVTASAPGATATASFSLTNTAPPPLGAGNYVYYLSGEDTESGFPGPYFVAGVFTVNSSGAVTGGEQSFVDNVYYEQDNILSSGSSVVAGNNGNILITLNTGDSKIGVAGVETFDASMVSSTNGLLTEYDAWASGSGTLDLQTSVAAPSGGYAFFLGGVDYLGGPIVIGGVINVDNVGGAGNISGAGSVFDESDDGFLSPVQLFAASTVTSPDAFGQVVFTLNPLTSDDLTIFEFQMVGYMVDADHIRWVENDFHDSLGGNTGGVALSQGSKTGTYSSTDISGSSGVFGAVGADTNGPLQTAGLLTFNADGSLSGNLSYNDFVALTPQGGTTLAAEGATLCSSGTALTPCYTVDATGRVTMTNVTDSTAAPTFNYNLQLYLAHAGAVVISMDLKDWSAGLGYAQTGSGTFTAGSFSGNYSLNVDQQDTPGGLEYDGIGTVMADGTSAFTGFLDLNGILDKPLTPTPGKAGGVTGTFTANPNGVFTGTITGIDTVSAATADNFTFYLIGATSGASLGVIGIENDDTEQLTLATFELQQ